MLESNMIITKSELKSSYQDRLESMTQKAVDEKNRTMYALLQHMERYGSVREDVFVFLEMHPFPDSSSQKVITFIQNCLKSTLPAAWYDLMQTVLVKDPDTAIYLFEDLKYAYENGIDLEQIKEQAITTESPYQFHEYISYLLTNEKEYEGSGREEVLLLQLNHLVAEFQTGLQRLEKVVFQLETQNVQQTIETEGTVVLEEQLLEDQEDGGNSVKTEEVLENDNDFMDFDEEILDESLVPDIDYDVPELQDDIFEENEMLSEDKEETVDTFDSIPELEQDDMEELAEDRETDQLVIRSDLENDLRCSSRKRMLCMLRRMVSLERSRFLKMDRRKQQNFLIKQVLDKKYSASMLEVMKQLFGVISNESIYDLIIRNATEEEMKNVLLLKDM